MIRRRDVSAVLALIGIFLVPNPSQPHPPLTPVNVLLFGEGLSHEEEMTPARAAAAGAKAAVSTVTFFDQTQPSCPTAVRTWR